MDNKPIYTEQAMFEVTEDYNATIDGIMLQLDKARKANDWSVVDDLLSTFSLPFTAANGDCKLFVQGGD